MLGETDGHSARRGTRFRPLIRSADAPEVVKSGLSEGAPQKDPPAPPTLVEHHPRPPKIEHLCATLYTSKNSQLSQLSRESRCGKFSPSPTPVTAGVNFLPYLLKTRLYKAGDRLRKSRLN
ncbi:hypothetical protein RRG08_016766 [Elysia crispata]|uniref:Uncharacterized protein n=1 Tax=Elysia crispata TaxID=231223 RepID=A0AAE1A145_9GAST|nr:hypothetical protein RRG08_016766 [Elysia crispata]